MIDASEPMIISPIGGKIGCNEVEPTPSFGTFSAAISEIVERKLMR
jgi:hypothetical protein